MNYRNKIFLILFLGILLLFSQSSLENSQYVGTTSEKISVDLVRIVDGDTLVVRINNKEEKVRIIGIDTPESVRPNYPVECFGTASFEYIEFLIGNNELFLEFDETQGMRDRNGRLLAHVFVQDINIGERMIADGYAYEYTYDTPYIYQADYQKVEQTAQNQDKGLWSPETCNGSV